MPAHPNPSRTAERNTVKWNITLPRYVFDEAKLFAKHAVITEAEYIRTGVRLIHNLGRYGLSSQTRIVVPSGERHPLPTVELDPNKDRRSTRKWLEFPAAVAADYEAIKEVTGEGLSEHITRGVECLNYMGRIGVGPTILLENVTTKNPAITSIDMVLPFYAGVHPDTSEIQD